MNFTEIPGIIINSTPYGDYDLILKIIVQNYGKISVFARSAKKSSKRFGGKVDLLDRGMLTAKEGKGSLLFLDSFSMRAPFVRLRENLAAISAASIFCECYDALIQESNEHPEAFDHLDDALRKLDALSPHEPKKAGPLLYHGLQTLLMNEGFGSSQEEEFSPRAFSHALQTIEQLIERPLKTRNTVGLIL